MLLNNVVAEPKAQTGTTVFLSGKERLEDSGSIIRSYAMPGVGDGDANSGPPAIGPFMRTLYAETEAALLAHRVHRVGNEI